MNDKNDHKLVRRAFDPLPLGAIQPARWLRNQLRIQADGLSGHLDEFWPAIKDSGWIGGGAEGWERGPYWLDGVIPLAVLLDDEGLREKVTRWMDYILTHQSEDGWLGPVKTKGPQANDPWPGFVALKAMAQYHEAFGDDRVVPAMLKFLRRLDTLVDEKPLADWAMFRWMDLLIPIHWVYERTGEDWLLDLAAKAKLQGYDWQTHFADFQHKERVPLEDSRYYTHVVNNAMALKGGAVWSRQSNDATDRDDAYRAIEMLDTYHGQVAGVFSGDEHYAGRSPSQGTELCAVAEYLYSLETLVAIVGDPALADRLEQIAFNALPATFKPDMWAHQYDQQANQVICRIDDDRPFASNGGDANIFGLEPNFGCCTANMHQAWPKFASSLWMRSPDGGLAAVAYAPCTVSAGLDSGAVRVTVDTEYPFRDTIKLTVEGGGTFALRLRIPTWAEGAQVSVDGGAPADAGGFHCIERDWSGSTRVELRLPMRTRLERRYHDSVAVLRGPLVYSLKIGESWKQVKGEAPHADWEVHPTTQWNYGLALDEGNPDASVSYETRPIGDCPFSPDGAPVEATVKGRLVPEWGLQHNAAGDLPQSPVTSEEPEVDLTLIPYGCTNLRVTEFPLIG